VFLSVRGNGAALKRGIKMAISTKTADKKPTSKAKTLKAEVSTKTTKKATRAKRVLVSKAKKKSV
jgi:hypothetical protein